MSTIYEAPMTWLDVARALAAHTPREQNVPSGVVRARVSRSGLTIETVDEGREAAVFAWLTRRFPGRIDEQELFLRLEGPHSDSTLPIDIDVVGADTVPRQSLGVVDGIIDLVNEDVQYTDAAADSGEAPPFVTARPVPVVAALSVKGGTGRTTTAIAFANRWAVRENRPVLIVDADLEAPGISYLFESYAGVAKIALEDVIALAHAEEDPNSPETIAFVSGKLKDHVLNERLIVLPLRRDIDELASSAIRPEHLSTPDRPFALADILSRIASSLNCVGVVIDVRAGLVPLGVTLAMDPDVSPIFVTTIGSQSLRATSGLLRFLSREARRYGRTLRTPLVVFNRVPQIFQQSGMDQTLTAPLLAELSKTFDPDTSSELSPTEDRFSNAQAVLPFVRVSISEIAALLVPSGDWSEYWKALSDSGFGTSLSTAADMWIKQEFPHASPASLPPEADIAVTGEVARERLKKLAEELISAENAEGQVPKPLVTMPLSSLAGRFLSEVPVAVIEGAKGTGKTLAARYFISQRSWRNIVREFVEKDDAVEGTIISGCASVQSSASYASEVNDARQQSSNLLGEGVAISVEASTLYLKARLRDGLDDLAWVDVWLDVIAWSAGHRSEHPGAGATFIQSLRASAKTAVAVLEGLEELYSSITDNGVTSAMRAALIHLPLRLRSEARRPLGVIVFARRDTVEAAVSQNLDQYRRDYGPFALKWTEDDVLELAAWLATKSEAIPGLWDSSFGSRSQTDKTKALEELWGAKLGPNDTPGKRTREAYTATWIVAVLSDLRRRLVPRDLVRFLSNACAETLAKEDRSEYGRRLLVPTALKDAVGPTSDAKVSETQEEIEELKPIFAKFKAHAGSAVSPLTEDTLATLGISTQEVDVLVRHGVVYGDRAPFEVPELFRRGLGLKHAGARRSVVNLYRKARSL